MKYKMIFLDIDGTLTNSKKEITPKTKAALIKAQEMGIIAAIASGRPDKGVSKYIKELELERFGGYVLSYNGGRIREMKTGRTVIERSIAPQVFAEAHRFAHVSGVDILTYRGDVILAENAENKYLEIESRINGMSVEIHPDITSAVCFNVPKCLLLGDGDRMSDLEPNLKVKLFGRADVFRSEPFFLEVMPYKTDKAAAIANLCGVLGIEREETMAFGDGFNDVSMISHAGMGVAMENACDAAKKAADFITLSNEEDGIAHALEKFVF